MEATAHAHQQLRWRTIIQSNPRMGRWAEVLGFLYISVLLLMPAVVSGDGFVGRGIRADQLLLLGMTPLLAVLTPNATLRALREPITLALFAFALLACITALASLVMHAASAPALAAASVWGHSRPLLVFVFGYVLCSRLPPQRRIRLVALMMIPTAAIAALAIAQFVGRGPIYEYAIATYSRAMNQDAVAEALTLGRVYASFDGQPNVLGSFIVLVLPFMLALLVRARAIRRMFLATALAVLLFVLGASWSRGAYAGAMTAFAATAVFSGLRKGLKLAAMSSAALASVSFFVPDRVLERINQFTTGRDAAGLALHATRLPYWRANFSLFLEHPLLGIRGVQTHPFDSLYLSVLVLGGVLGFAAFGTAIGQVFRFARRCERQVPFGHALIAATLALLVNGISAPTFFSERVQELYWFLVALAVTPVAGLAHMTHHSGDVQGRSAV